ncbi:helix-turn-helix transcriptional regulator [Halobaculum lipolyticum]|uniref:Helix-turn-helix transcriptional regulator n=1 Tax=Halobaculum lipolyticum TaxID=3032001 RepID=A0ABD5WEM6_9EURY
MTEFRPNRLQNAGQPAHRLVTDTRDARAHLPDPSDPTQPKCRMSRTDIDWTHVDATETDADPCQWCAPTPADPEEFDVLANKLRHTDADDLRADGGTVERLAWNDIRAFQGDLLLAIARLEREGATVYGLAIKRNLERTYSEEINHGRLYPALDDLVEKDLIEKTQLDGRTNEYCLTETGYDLLETRSGEFVAALRHRE